MEIASIDMLVAGVKRTQRKREQRKELSQKAGLTMRVNDPAYGIGKRKQQGVDQGVDHTGEGQDVQGKYLTLIKGLSAVNYDPTRRQEAALRGAAEQQYGPRDADDGTSYALHEDSPVKPMFRVTYVESGETPRSSSFAVEHQATLNPQDARRVTDCLARGRLMGYDFFDISYEELEFFIDYWRHDPGNKVLREYYEGLSPFRHRLPPRMSLFSPMKHLN